MVSNRLVSLQDQQATDPDDETERAEVDARIAEWIERVEQVWLEGDLA